MFVEVKMAGPKEHTFTLKAPKFPSDHSNPPGLCLTGQGSSCWSAPWTIPEYNPQGVATAKAMTPEPNSTPICLSP